MCELPLLVVRRRQHLIWRSEFSQERKKWFLARCVYHWVFILSAVSLYSSALHSKQDKHVFRNLEEWKKPYHLHGSRFPLLRQTWVLARFYSLFLCAMFPSATRHFYRDVMSSNVPHLVSVPEGEHVPPQDNSGLQHGAFLFFFFFPWQMVNSHLRFVTRRHRPDQSLTGFHRGCAVCHPRL